MSTSRASRTRRASSSSPVHYRGATPAINDMMGGHTNMMLVSVSLALPLAPRGQDQDAQHRQREAAAAASRHSRPRRNPASCRATPPAPGSAWRSRAGTPRDDRDKINADVRADLRRARRSRSGSWTGSSPRRWDARRRSSTTSSAPKRQTWAKVIREQKLKIELALSCAAAAPRGGAAHTARDSTPPRRPATARARPRCRAAPRRDAP